MSENPHTFRPATKCSPLVLALVLLGLLALAVAGWATFGGAWLERIARTETSPEAQHTAERLSEGKSLLAPPKQTD